MDTISSRYFIQTSVGKFDWQKKGSNAKNDEIGVAAAAEGNQTYCSLNQFCLHRATTTTALLFLGAIALISGHYEVMQQL